MIFQSIDWRAGFSRRMVVIQVEKLLTRLRELNNGIVPLYLTDWDDFLAFCGEARIAIPPTEAAARSIKVNGAAYPTVQWLEGCYSQFLQFVMEKAPQLLEDLQSRKKDKGETCSALSPPTSSPISTPNDSVNSLLTAIPRRSQTPQT